MAVFSKKNTFPILLNLTVAFDSTDHVTLPDIILPQTLNCSFKAVTLCPLVMKIVDPLRLKKWALRGAPLLQYVSPEPRDSKR